MIKKSNPSLEIVKKIREQTGAGIMDCQWALREAKGNYEKAIEKLGVRHQKAAVKKVSRTTSEGRVFAYIHNNGRVGAMVFLLCETDFVARTDGFQSLGKELAMQIAAMSPTSSIELLKQEYIRDPKITVKELINKVIAQTGENIRIGEISRLGL